MRVLVVEDDQPLVRIMTKSLESNGFEVTSAFDGEDGLRAARDDRPDAIVLDLQLPRLNGVDLCRRLRSEGNAVPILMLTARSTVPDRIGGLDAGADD
jgi:two-component system, OmpR family, response regulator MprA